MFIGFLHLNTFVRVRSIVNVMNETEVHSVRLQTNFWNSKHVLAGPMSNEARLLVLADTGADTEV